MSRTVRELIRVLERASSQAPLGDLSEIVVGAVLRVGGSDVTIECGIPGEGETAEGAHFDPDTKRVVIDAVEL